MNRTLRRRCIVIPSENASPARTEGFREVTFKFAQRDPSTVARDDTEPWFTVALRHDKIGGNECLSLPIKPATRRAD